MSEGDITFSRIGSPPGLEVVHGRHIRHSFPPHRHGTLCIGFIEKGKRVIRCRGSNHTVQAGTVFVINPGEVHACSSPNERGHTYRMLCVDRIALQLAMPELSDEPEWNLRFKSLNVTDERWYRNLRYLCDVLVSGESACLKQSLFVSVFTDFITNFAECPIKQKGVDRAGSAIRIAREFLEDNASQDISIFDLASVSGLSPFHLIRIFKKTIGITPHIYQTHGKIKRAKKLLVDGMPIAQVALVSGFHDQSHFTKTFKRVIGITPFRYIKNASTIGAERKRLIYEY